MKNRILSFHEFINSLHDLFAENKNMKYLSQKIVTEVTIATRRSFNESDLYFLFRVTKVYEDSLELQEYRFVKISIPLKVCLSSFNFYIEGSPEFPNSLARCYLDSTSYEFKYPNQFVDVFSESCSISCTFAQNFPLILRLLPVLDNEFSLLLDLINTY